jgi:hypothetical protein
MERLSTKKMERLSRRTRAEIKGALSLCSLRAGGLGTESGLMAPVHPLGGELRFPQFDEEVASQRYESS